MAEAKVAGSSGASGRNDRPNGDGREYPAADAAESVAGDGQNRGALLQEADDDEAHRSCDGRDLLGARDDVALRDPRSDDHDRGDGLRDSNLHDDANRLEFHDGCLRFLDDDVRALQDDGHDVPVRHLTGDQGAPVDLAEYSGARVEESVGRAYREDLDVQVDPVSRVEASVDPGVLVCPVYRVDLEESVAAPEVTDDFRVEELVSQASLVSPAARDDSVRVVAAPVFQDVKVVPVSAPAEMEVPVSQVYSEELAALVSRAYWDDRGVPEVVPVVVPEATDGFRVEGPVSLASLVSPVYQGVKVVPVVRGDSVRVVAAPAFQGAKGVPVSARAEMGVPVFPGVQASRADHAVVRRALRGALLFGVSDHRGHPRRLVAVSLQSSTLASKAVIAKRIG